MKPADEEELDYWMTRLMNDWKTALLILVATTALAGDPKITCEPRELRGVPGEPLQVELTIETDHAVPMQLRIPSINKLVLRTVEKIPIQRTPEGRYVQKRIVIWQGVEAGTTTLTNLMVQTGTTTQLLPNIAITIDAVIPAEPPAKKEAE
jgi:hypothetical protein